MRRTIAIAIPTYNRPEILEENLTYMLPFLNLYNIPVYISDDSNNNLTERMVAKLQKKYLNLKYRKNVENLGHDKNCLKTLSLPFQDYIWYLGDSQIINEKYIASILELIQCDYAFIVGSSEGRIVDIDTRNYDVGIAFFEDLAWHATLTGVTIYKREILDLTNYEKYYASNFVQLGIILDEMVNISNKLYWLNEPIIYKNTNKEISYWSSNVFAVFSKDWSNFILSLPSYYNNSKIKVIKSHSMNTEIFGHDSFVTYKKNGVLNWREFIKYYKYIKLSSSIKIYEILFILIVPKWIFKAKEYVNINSKNDYNE